MYKILKDELKFEENKTYLSVDNESKKWYKNATKNKERVKIFLDTNCNNRPFKQDNDKLIYNFAWDKYSRGLMDVLIELKLGKTIIQENKKDINKSYVGFITEICQESDNLNENSYDEQFNKLKSLIKTFHKNIFSISDTISYDFLKELYCKNLIKDDIHIKECYKEFIDKQATKKIDKHFLHLCHDYKKKSEKQHYTPYYIDKILWLCSTGNFYKDGITITKMNKPNFFKFCRRDNICPQYDINTMSKINNLSLSAKHEESI